ncbi:MAG: dihydroneopterin aldolase [bacterium]|nr:dihydroneopterin aldolase [bacterium]
MALIKINNAKFYAYHGVLDYEKEHGNEFEVDIEMNCSLDELKDSDDLSKTVDYLAVYNLVKKIFTGKKYDLIESVNQNVCKGIIENFPPVNSVKVNIRKLNAPLGIIDSVEIQTELKR